MSDIVTAVTVLGFLAVIAILDYQARRAQRDADREVGIAQRDREWMLTRISYLEDQVEPRFPIYRDRDTSEQTDDGQHAPDRSWITTESIGAR